jgi:hypothetical protein
VNGIVAVPRVRVSRRAVVVAGVRVVMRFTRAVVVTGVRVVMCSTRAVVVTGVRVVMCSTRAVVVAGVRVGSLTCCRSFGFGVAAEAKADG